MGWHDLRCSSIGDFIGNLRMISMSGASNQRIDYTYDINTTVPSNSNDCIERPEVHTDNCSQWHVLAGAGRLRNRFVDIPLIFAAYLTSRMTEA
jgi:hypothetical protein